jgi:hypothetical protein
LVKANKNGTRLALKLVWSQEIEHLIKIRSILFSNIMLLFLFMLVFMLMEFADCVDIWSIFIGLQVRLYYSRKYCN